MWCGCGSRNNKLTYQYHLCMHSSCTLPPSLPPSLPSSLFLSLSVSFPLLPSPLCLPPLSLPPSLPSSLPPSLPPSPSLSLPLSPPPSLLPSLSLRRLQCWQPTLLGYCFPSMLTYQTVCPFMLYRLWVGPCCHGNGWRWWAVLVLWGW